jgi:hypothetical protein
MIHDYCSLICRYEPVFIDDIESFLGFSVYLVFRLYLWLLREYIKLHKRRWTCLCTVGQAFSLYLDKKYYGRVTHGSCWDSDEYEVQVITV